MNHASTKWLMAALCMLGSWAQAASEESPRITQIATERCDACHGAKGQGANAMFPKLAGQNPDYLMGQISQFKSGKRHSYVMRYQLVDLSQADVAALASHYSATRLDNTAVATDTARYEAGRAIYAQLVARAQAVTCDSCHGASARGGPGVPRLAGQHADYLADQIRRFADGSRDASASPGHASAYGLSGSQIDAVSYFLAALDGGK